MLNREQLETFASVVEGGGFDRAAVTLNVTRAAISQRIKALEESLSTVLLVREKPVVPTASGELLMRHVKILRLTEGSVMAELAPKGHDKKLMPIAIAVNADSLATWLSPALWPFLLSQRIALELLVDDQDHTLNRLAKGEVIGCISTKVKPTLGFEADPLGEMEYRCYATPEFANRHFSNGFTLQAALDAPAVVFNRKDSLHDEFLESVFGFPVARYIKHYLPAPNILRDAILMGAGYGVLPALHVSREVEERMLIEVVPDQVMRVPLYWHRWGVELPIFQEVTRFVVNTARSVLRPTQA